MCQTLPVDSRLHSHRPIMLVLSPFARAYMSHQLEIQEPPVCRNTVICPENNIKIFAIKQCYENLLAPRLTMLSLSPTPTTALPRFLNMIEFCGRDTGNGYVSKMHNFAIGKHRLRHLNILHQMNQSTLHFNVDGILVYCVFQLFRVCTMISFYMFHYTTYTAFYFGISFEC